MDSRYPEHRHKHEAIRPLQETMMQTCSNCGASIREGAKFCTSCGTRLNDSATTTTSAWEAPASGTTATDTSSTTETPSWASSASSESETSASTTASAEGKNEGGFSWSWGSPSTTAQESEQSTTQVDDESGTVIDEVSTSESDPNTVTDATEVEILEDEPATTDETSADAVRSDDEAVNDDTTLADFAGQWSDEETGTAEATPEPVTQSAAATSKEVGEDGEKEDTVAKAERLIGELRAIIPSLARPRPPVGARSQAGPKPGEIADELESAARVGNFDDLRDTLLAARNNPRDIDSMMSLSGKVDRLLELFDDRNNLAKTAESVASRLRGSENEERPADRSTEL
jgi:hypothetical protein